MERTAPSAPPADARSVVGPAPVRACAQDGPSDVIWDITYACPLRCTHCYSESGRRPSRQLDEDHLLRVTDAILALAPRSVILSGGEPLLVKGVFAVAERLRSTGVEVVLYTGGWMLDEPTAERVVALFDRVSVSVDGASGDVHDRIRSRRGSFQRAMAALGHLDHASARRASEGAARFAFGIDYTVVESNFRQMEEACATFGARFPGLRYICFGAAVPTGLASRADYVTGELLTEEHLRSLVSRELLGRLRVAAPGTVRVVTTDNRMLQMHPEQTRHPADFPVLQVEPDGEVRAMAIYEGTVGNLLTDDPRELWRRAVARWQDPFVVAALGTARSTQEWAEATRRIDQHFGSAEVRARIARRPVFLAPPPSPAWPTVPTVQEVAR